MNIINKDIYNNLDLLPEDLSGWNGDNKIFGQLIEEIKPKVIIEVGTWKGLSAINMGKHVRKNNLNTTIYCVDTWLGAIEFWDKLNNTKERNLLLKNGYPQIYYQFLSNVVHNDLQDIILPFPNTSENGFRYFKSKQINADLIYIDASHEYDDVYRDISNYINILNQGGVIFGDDYKHWIDVRNAVNNFTKENNLRLEIIEDHFWLIKK
jgi:hypothetical protein